MHTGTKKARRVALFSLLGLFLALLITAVCLMLYWKVNLPGWFSEPKPGVTYWDVVYKTVDGRALHLDVYQPTRRLFTKSPTIFYYHGGGWNSGDKGLDDDEIVNAVLDYGLTIVSVEYRLTDELTVYPAFLDDCADAIRFMTVHAEEYNVDKDRFAVFGASAGGQISLMMSLCGEEYGSDTELAETELRIKCGVAACAPTDFLNLDVYERDEDRAEAVALLEGLFGGSPEEMPDVYRDASPIQHIRKDTPPIFLAHGTKDDIVPFGQATAFVEAAKAAGMSLEFHPSENANHKFRSSDGTALSPTLDEIVDEMVDFLVRELIL